VGASVVVAGFGDLGDLGPMLAIAEGLRRRGHAVRFVTLPPVSRHVADAGLPFELLDVPRPNRVTPTPVRDDDVAAALRLAVTAAPADACIVGVLGAGAARLAFAGTGLPWVVVNPGYRPDPRTAEDDHDDAWVAQVLALSRASRDATLVLHGSDAVFNGEPELDANERFVGPLLWSAAAPVPPWLADPGDPWALVTLSTLRQDDLAIARCALDALADRRLRVLATLGPHQPVALRPVPANARVAQFVPHDAVVPGAALFVGHGGSTSIMRALRWGVPMVLVPCGRDQAGGASRAARLGVAEVVQRSDLDAPRLTTAIDRVLGDATYRDAARHHAARLQAADPLTAACDHIDAVLPDVRHRQPRRPSPVSSPTITVTMPYHGSPTTIERAVSAVLTQTHDDLRLVVVNDGDTATPPWPHLADIDDDRLVRFDLPCNRGRYFADAVTLAACDTEWFAVHDADDWCEPDWLARLLAAAEAGSLDAVFSAQVCHGLDGRTRIERVGRLDCAGPRLRFVASHHGLYRTQALRRAGGYHPGFRVSYDTLVVNLMVLTGRAGAVDKPLYHRVARPGSLTTAETSGLGSPHRADSHARLAALYDAARAAGSAAPVVADAPGALRRAVEREAARLALAAAALVPTGCIGSASVPIA